MLTDYHSHILPAIDDGAQDAAMSLAMIDMLKAQGVKRIIATPHFYAQRERSVADFLTKRQAAFEKIAGRYTETELLLGAEIAIEQGISERRDIRKLAVQGSDLILLELPYARYSQWIAGEIYNIAVTHQRTPVLAHVHRYLEYYTEQQMQKILELPAVFQINNEAFANRKQARFVRQLLQTDLPIVFGSDCHNLQNRKPNWELTKQKCSAEILEAANGVYEQYRGGYITF